MKLSDLKHLLHRAGFGVSQKQLSMLPRAKEDVVQLMFKNSEPIKNIEILPSLEEYKTDIRRMMQNGRESVSKFNREKIRELNYAWMQKLVGNEQPLREKMTLFWHDHFACRIQNSYFLQQQNNTFRKYALGDFGDLLHAIARDPAMLKFLNNQQNKKTHPNENFARELLELFTIGRGNYLEKDVQEAARSFTGWGFDNNGEFVFRKSQHDYGFKSFMGNYGRISGEDILDILIKDPNTARTITKKIWTRFVSPELNPSMIEELSREFYQSGLNIEYLLMTIFNSEWFYEDKYKGSIIKQPVDLLVGLNIELEIENRRLPDTTPLQHTLNQILFVPPGVNGWPRNTAWIDSSSIVYRLLIPTLLFEKSIKRTEFKSVEPEWNRLNAEYSFSLDDLESYLLATPLKEKNKKWISKYKEDADGAIEQLKRSWLAICSLPEYQLS